MDTPNIIANIKSLCRERGVTQQSVLPNGGLTKLMANWRYQNQSPSVETIQRVADGFRSVGVLCSVAFLTRETIPEREAPEENSREPVGLFDSTGSGLEAVTILWQTYEGKICEEFITRMQQLDLWRKVQIYHRKNGEWIYGFVGGYYIQSLGEWALEAPGNVVGEIDPDPDYAAWTTPIWDEVMDTGPRRWRCLVRSDYGGPKGLDYEGAYFDCELMGKRALVMASTAML